MAQVTQFVCDNCEKTIESNDSIISISLQQRIALGGEAVPTTTPPINFEFCRPQCMIDAAGSMRQAVENQSDQALAVFTMGQEEHSLSSDEKPTDLRS